MLLNRYSLAIRCLWFSAGILVPLVVSAQVNGADLVVPDQDSQDKSDELAPAEVVQFQMQALSEWRESPEAASRVFELASPANRAVTGPLERFKQMVESEPYNALIDNAGWTTGKATKAEGVAVVLVTLVDRSGQLRAFRFYLSRQLEAAGGRWMTDGVFALPMLRRAPLNEPSRAERSRI